MAIFFNNNESHDVYNDELAFCELGQKGLLVSVHLPACSESSRTGRP